MNRYVVLVAILSQLASVPIARSAEGEHHPHHIAVGTGLARHDSKTSVYLGVDYAYRFRNDFAIAVFFEDVRGDFDIQAFGLTFGKYFDNGWKVGTGPGVETKLKRNKNLLLWHVSGGYDWHRGNWSFGPTASFDFIEDSSNTFYFGFAVGYGF